MQDFITYISDEWAVIAQAPLTFVIALFFVASLVYLLTKGLSGGKVSVLKKVIARREREIAEFKQKLGSYSPDEISARIELLTQKVRSFRRGLCEADRAALSAALAQTSGMVEIKQDAQCADAEPYAHDIGLAFKNAGWRVVHVTETGLANPAPSGLGLIVRMPSQLDKKQQLIADALRSISAPFDIQDGGNQIIDRGTVADILVNSIVI